MGSWARYKKPKSQPADKVRGKEAPVPESSGGWLFLGFRRSLKARLLFRGVVYSLIALVGGVWLGIKVPTLWIIYGLAIIAFLTDFVAVYLQQQESIAAVCLSTPFVGQPMAIGIIGYGVYSC